MWPALSRGNGANSGGKYKGIAPESKIINLRVLDETGSGSDSWVIAAIDRAIELKFTYNIRIINLSLGRPIFESFRTIRSARPSKRLTRRASWWWWRPATRVATTLYNSMGYGTINAPGNDPFVITVGAMKAEGTANKSDDLIASYSSKGPSVVDHFVKPDLVAPGNIIASLRVAGSTLDKSNPGQPCQPVSLRRPR